MSGSGPLITATLEKIRGYVDDETANQKYTDAFVLTHHLMPAIQEVQGRLAMNDGNPVVMPYRFNLVADQKVYELPPAVRTIIRLMHIEETSNAMIHDVRPRGEFHPSGYGWRMSGNMLEFFNTPKSTEKIEIRYVHNGDMCPHYYSTGGVLTDYTTNGGAQRIVLAATPTNGSLDRRTNAYAGQMLRLIPADGSQIEERVISRSYYSSGTWYAEVDLAFTNAATTTPAHPYEIVPYGFGAIWEAMAVRAAMKLATYRDVTAKMMGMLEREYSRALKTALDNVAFIVSREPIRFDDESRDNPNYWVMGDGRS